MKKMAITLIVGMVLVSFASAGLVDFLSNTIEGDVTVMGPIFYTAASENLLMNEEPDTSSTKTIDGIGEVDFIMDERLGGIDFGYVPKLNFVVDLEINNYSSSRTIQVEFGYIKTNGNSERLCNIQHIGITGDGVVEFECDAIEEMEDVDYFYYTIEGCADESIEYKVKTKSSYVEVIGIV